MTSSTGDQSPVAEEVRADDKAVAGGDSPKRHGDKLSSGTAPQASGSETGGTGDSPKPHGDKLSHAITEARRAEGLADQPQSP